MRRFPVAALLLSTLACGSAANEPTDAGLKPLAKDAVVVDEGDAAGADAEPHDAGFHPDAALPDATPIVDRDRDGIPDDEDPSPDAPNTPLFVDTFESIAAEWLFTSTAMHVEPSASVLRVPNPEPFVREGWLGSRPLWRDVFIRSLIRVNRLGVSDDAGAARIGLMARIQQVAPDRYLLCGVDLKRGLAFLSEHNGGDAAGRDLATSALTKALGEWSVVNLYAQGSIVRCTVDDIVLDATSPLFSVGSAGFRTFDAAFEADWFEVYEL